MPQFPARVRVSLYAHLTGGHGRYPLELCLRDAEEEAVWRWRPPGFIDMSDPLVPVDWTSFNLELEVPRPGKYRLALLTNGKEFAQQGLWFGPSAAFRS